MAEYIAEQWMWNNSRLGTHIYKGWTLYSHIELVHRTYSPSYYIHRFGGLISQFLFPYRASYSSTPVQVPCRFGQRHHTPVGSPWARVCASVLFTRILCALSLSLSTMPSYMPVFASSSTMDRQFFFPRGPVTMTILTARAFLTRHLRATSTSLTLIRLTICFLIPFFALTLLSQLW